MSKRCELLAVRAQAGNNVSHSHKKTRRLFRPNLQSISFHSDTLGRSFSLRVAASTIRTVDHNGGLDSFLLSTANSNLAPEALKLKQAIKKASAVAGDSKKENAS